MRFGICYGEETYEKDGYSVIVELDGGGGWGHPPISTCYLNVFVRRLGHQGYAERMNLDTAYAEKHYETIKLELEAEAIQNFRATLKKAVAERYEAYKALLDLESELNK